MDGTLAKYRRKDFVRTPPLFMIEGLHYFKHQQPDTKMIRILKHILSCTNNVTILTSLPDTPLFYEQKQDKIDWLKKYCPFINITTQFLITKSGKRQHIEEIQNKHLTRFDILIDDYNPNLIEWERGGGTGVKYLNGINSRESYDGPVLPHNTSADTLADFLVSFRPELIPSPYRKD